MFGRHATNHMAAQRRKGPHRKGRGHSGTGSERSHFVRILLRVKGASASNFALCRGALAPWGVVGLVLPPLLCLVLTLPPGATAAEERVCKETIVATTADANFREREDGTAFHKTTGLVWMRCGLGQTWDGKGCSGDAAGYAWSGALRAADAHEFAGHSDWRLPNKNELESIVEDRCNAPAINAAVFPDTPAAYFWSSSPYAGFSHGAWSVDFSSGSVNASVKSGSLNVRLVRGPE